MLFTDVGFIQVEVGLKGDDIRSSLWGLSHIHVEIQSRYLDI
jgi:hypothetical protein